MSYAVKFYAYIFVANAITENWRVIQKGSERKGEALAIFYRLHIHPDLWLGITTRS